LDVEFVQTKTDGAPMIVQQRPIIARAAPSFPATPPDRAVWKHDAEHNPEPLSPAQEGLVALVGEGPGLRQRVLCGYLYFSREGASPPRRLYAPHELKR